MSAIRYEDSGYRGTDNDVPLTVTSDCERHRWNDYVSLNPAGTVEHLWEWQQIFRDVFRQEPLYLAASRHGEVTGILPLVKFRSLLFGRSLVSLPYANYAGLIANDRETADALIAEGVAEARRFGARHVELRHVERQTGNLPVRQHKVGSRLALPATSEELWGKLDRKVRNQIRKAQKEQLTIEVGGNALLDDFYGVFSRNMRDLGTPVFPRKLFAETVAKLPCDVRVFVVRHATTPIAAAIGIGWRQTMLVPWASALREHRHRCANMLCYWSMLEFAISQQYRVFDFGRSTSGGGTHQFKQQWGAFDVPLHWEYALFDRNQPPDTGVQNPRMSAAISLWQHFPVAVANGLGPLVIRMIP